MTPLTPSYGPKFRPNDRLTGSNVSEWQRVSLFAAARHFQKLHRLYGVASGLIVTTEDDTIKVSKGVAFDGFGRPLCWPGSKKEDIIEGRDEWFSTAESRAESRTLILQGEEPKHLKELLKLPVPAPQASKLALVEPECSIQPWDVPLATLKQKPANGVSVLEEPDLAIRPLTIRTFRRPYIATGTLPSGTTAVSLSGAIGWQVWIDTQAAGFLPPSPGDEEPVDSGPEPKREKRPPIYLVSIGSPSAEDSQRFRTGQAVLDPTKSIPPQPPLVSVSDPAHDGFLLSVNYDATTENVDEFFATPLEVWWMGIEQRATDAQRRQPAVDQTEILDMGQSVARRQLPWRVFADDQRLTATDLNDLQDTVRALQWIHNKSLHDWGVAEGCAVSALPDRPGVMVLPGYAIDAQGREVIISETRQLNVPAQKVTSSPDTKKTWWVTASYIEKVAPRHQDPSSRQEGNPVRRLPEAAVGWRDPEENESDLRLIPGQDVILATVELQQGQVLSVSTVGRRSAVPPKQPYIYAGRQKLDPAKLDARTPDLKTDSPLRPLSDDDEWAWATIDTSDAGFVGVPRYFFTIEWNQAKVPATIAAQPFIENPQSTQFYLTLPTSWLPGDDQKSQGLLAWCLLLLLLLFLALALPGLWPGDSIPAWIGSVLCGLAVVLTGGLAARRAGQPRALQSPTTTDLDMPVAWETVVKNWLGKVLGRFLPLGLFTDPGATPAVRRSRRLATVALPIPMLLVHLFRSPLLQNFSWLKVDPVWIWIVSIACAVLAAAPSLLTAIQQRLQGAGTESESKNDQTDELPTIAWMGIEV